MTVIKVQMGHRTEPSGNKAPSTFFLAVFGLRCCAQAFSSCGERGLLFVAVPGVLAAVASLVVEHRL